MTGSIRLLDQHTRRWSLILLRLSRREMQFAADFTARSRVHLAVYEFVRFGVKMAWACLHPVLMLALLSATFLWLPRGGAVSRYDFMTLVAIALQVIFIVSGAETLKEARIGLAFHIAGTALEILKTSQGVWVYPDEGILRLGGVPLFTGFLYASIGSFMVRAWHLFDFRFQGHPRLPLLTALAVAIYVNFFVNRFVGDARPLLFFLVFLLFAPTVIHYRIWRVHRRMPLLVALVLTTFFVWLAENIGTLTATWLYPGQMRGWRVVTFHIYCAWALLLVVGYAMVARHFPLRGPGATMPT